MNTTREQLARVVVYQPCDCAQCRKPRPLWFLCDRLSDRRIAEYACDGYDGMSEVPHPANVAWIERQHPGMVLVYVKVGDMYGADLARYRKLQSI